MYEIDNRPLIFLMVEKPNNEDEVWLQNQLATIPPHSYSYQQTSNSQNIMLVLRDSDLALLISLKLNTKELKNERSRQT